MKACETVEKDAVLFSVQVRKLFVANIYAVYCAVKLVLVRKGRVMCDIFKETVLCFK